MLKGFRDFVLRGNVAELAVAFVMGVAFAAVVTAFTEAFLTPLIALVAGGGLLAEKTFTIGGAVFRWGAFVDAVMTFVLTALVIYAVVVVPLRRWQERHAAPVVQPAVRDCPECLSAIPEAARRCAFCGAAVEPAAPAAS